MSLEIKNLTKKFGEQTALHNINLDIDKNEIIGLLGPNGAGKSTLMKSIVGALKIDEGEIIFDGKNITEKETEVKKNIGFLPENNPLYFEMYVKEYLQFVADIHQISKEKVDEIIDLVGITPEKSKKIGQLSKGYKQRVGLAQAIIHQPDLLILDEPTSALDRAIQADILQILKKLQKERLLSYLFISHDLKIVRAISHTLIVMKEGLIVESGPCDRIFENPRNDYTQRLLKAAFEIDRKSVV